MSLVEILATLTPNAGSPLPIVDGGGNKIPHVADPSVPDDVATKGYVDTRSTTIVAFPTIADVVAHDFTGSPNGSMIVVTQPDDIYELLTAPSAGIIAATDGLSVIQPTIPSTARIVRKGAAYGFVANWYVNAATGNDISGDGSVSSPFASVERLCATLCPNGVKRTLQQSTTFHFAAGSYGTHNLNLDVPSGSGFTVTWVCDYTSSAPITLSSVVNTVPSPTAPVRGRLTTGTGTFVDKKRIRSTSGAHAGAITYSTGLTSATDTWVKQWQADANTGVVTIANGTTCTVDTLNVTFNHFYLAVASKEGTYSVNDAILTNGVVVTVQDHGSQTVLVNGCELANRVSGNIQLNACNFTAAASIGFPDTPQPIIRGCVFLSVLTLFSPTTMAALTDSACFNGGTIVLGGSISSILGSGAINCPTEWVNGIASPAIAMNSGFLYITGQQFGFGTLYSIGIQAAGGCTIAVTAASLLAIPATQQLSLAGSNHNYSEVPIVLLRAACAVVLASDSTSPTTANLASLTTNAPANVTRAAAAVGTGTAAARDDHKHDVSIAAPAAGSVAVGNSASAGTATTLAASDHVHPVSSAAPVNVGTANADGSATTFSRSDHVHNTPFSAVAAALNAASSSISINNQRITGALDPVNPQDLATKAYADAIAQGLDIKGHVVCMYSANVATLSGAPSATDGVTPATGDIVFLNGQTTTAQMGPWVTASGAWTRPLNFANGSHAGSAFFFVQKGTDFGDNGWVCTTDAPNDVVGTNNLAFAQFSGAGQVNAGAGLTKTGNTLDVVGNADGSIVVHADDVQVGVLATDTQHGTRGGGTQHANAVSGGAAGFQTGSDKKTNADLTAAGITQGDLAYYSGSAYTRLPASTSGFFLKTAGTVGPPSWVRPAASEITNDGVSASVIGTDVATALDTLYSDFAGLPDFTGAGLDPLTPLTWNGSSWVGSTTFGSGLGFVHPFIFNVDDDAGFLSTLYDWQDVGVSVFRIDCNPFRIVANVQSLSIAGASGVATIGSTNNLLLGGKNQILGSISSPNMQSMVGGIFITDATTAPTADPFGGFFLFVDPADGKLKARGPSGTITVLAVP